MDYLVEHGLLAGLSDNAKRLYDLLFTKDFKAEELTAQLESDAFSVDDINTASFRYVDALCHLIDYSDPRIENCGFGEEITGIESSHLLEAIQILLRFGLDPNYSWNNDITGNIMWSLHFAFNGYQAADAVNLMLEHGGNPNLIFDGWSLIGELCADISWFLGGDVESRHIADSFMHYLMVVIGHGAKWDNGNEIVVTYDGFNVADFKDHRNYYCGFIHVKYEDDPYNTTAVSFFDKRTNREVARLE